MGTGIFYFLLLVAVGTAIFKTSGHMSLIDALYLTVVSASTVGYGTLVSQNLRLVAPYCAWPARRLALAAELSLFLVF